MRTYAFAGRRADLMNGIRRLGEIIHGSAAPLQLQSPLLSQSIASP